MFSAADKKAKQQGFSDFQFARLMFKDAQGNLENEITRVRELRKRTNNSGCKTD